MDAWTKGLTAWAVSLGLLAVMAPAFQDDPAEPYAPASGYDAAQPASDPSPTPDQAAQPADEEGNSSPRLEDSYHRAERNVSSTGSGQWHAGFNVNATSPENLTVTVRYEPRDGQFAWSTTFWEYDLVDPNGTERWGAAGSGTGGPPFDYEDSTTIPGTEVPDGLWTFAFRWDGPTDVNIILEAWAERGSA